MMVFMVEPPSAWQGSAHTVPTNDELALGKLPATTPGVENRRPEILFQEIA
jgi:hypothetical protein